MTEELVTQPVINLKAGRYRSRSSCTFYGEGLLKEKFVLLHKNYWCKRYSSMIPFFTGGLLRLFSFKKVIV